jgi:phospholipid transport system substrate-binding protein
MIFHARRGGNDFELTMTLSARKPRTLMAMIAAVLAVALAPAMAPSQAVAAPADPAAARVDAFDHALIEMMKGGSALGARGRARRLAPAVEAAFDLSTMTRFAVGPKWAEMTPTQQAGLTAAFTRLSVASYAHNFDAYGGERFDLDPTVQTRGADKIVQCRLIPPHDKPVALLYRMRQTAQGWKIIDVYYDGVSQLTTRRADFAEPVASGGAPGLLAHLDALTEKLLR